jgi:hypothetical protein
MRTQALWILAIGAFFVWGVYPTSCPAQTASFVFTAEVRLADDFGSGLLEGVIGVGDTVTGRLVYDKALEDQSPDDPEEGLYFAQPLGINELSFSNSTFEYAASPAEFALAVFSVISRSGFASLEAEVNGITNPSYAEHSGIDDVLATIYLDDHEGTAWGSDALPMSLDLNHFQGPDDAAYLELRAFNETSFETFFLVQADLTSLRSAIPEPGAGALLLVSCLGFSGLRRYA